jgi:hypothetical protein
MASFAERRRAQFPESHARSTFDNSSDESEDEEERLSSRTGEAQEAPATGARGEKRALLADNDEAIEAEYGKTAKKKRLPLPKLEITDLIGADGLIRIPIEFKAIKYPQNKANNKKQNGTKKVDAAANYSRNLVSAYQSFCFDLFSREAFEDVLLKIEKLGSKKETKSFLQGMREQVRNQHVEKLYGRVKAEKMLQELDVGLQLQQQLLQEGEEDGGAMGELEESSESRPSDQVAAVQPQVSNTTTATTTTTTTATNTTVGGGYQDDEEEEEAVFVEEDEEPVEDTFTRTRLGPTSDKEDTNAYNDNDDDDDDDLLQTMAADRAPTIVGGVSQASSVSNRRRILDDDDSSDEEEATFQDVTAGTAVPANKSDDNESVAEADDAEMAGVLDEKDDLEIEGNKAFNESDEEEATFQDVTAGTAVPASKSDDNESIAEADDEEMDVVLDEKDDSEVEGNKAFNEESPVGKAAAAEEPEENMMHVEQQTPSTQSTVHGASPTQDSEAATIVPTQLATQETTVHGASPTQDSETATIVPTQSATQETIIPSMTSASQLDSTSQSDSDNAN